MEKFINSLDSMRSVSSNCDVKERFLDVCIKQEVVSRHTRVRCCYYMSLLAYAGINNQKDMVDILIKRKACKYVYTNPSLNRYSCALSLYMNLTPAAWSWHYKVNTVCKHNRSNLNSKFLIRQKKIDQQSSTCRDQETVNEHHLMSWLSKGASKLETIQLYNCLLFRTKL